MKFKIRKATPKDIPRIIDIQKNDGYVHAYYLTEPRASVLFSNGERFYGAYDEDHLMMGVASINVDIERMRIHFFFIHQVAQGRGVGTLLLNYVMRIAREEKVKNVYIYTEIDSPLERFLLRRNFIKAGYFKRRFGEKDANILSFYLL